MNLWGYISITTFMLLRPSIETLNSLRNQIKEYIPTPNPYTNTIGGQNWSNFGSKKVNFGEILKNIKKGG